MKLLTLIVLLNVTSCFALDTLWTHPFYPPLTYKSHEYNFYKYTPKYIPESMLHCFKILGTAGDLVLCEFKNRTELEVVEKGMYEKEYRIRKEFCLEGYSSFSSFFISRGIFIPKAMKTYILLSFHQYLNQERILWHKNKRTALKDLKKVNRKWKKRFKKIILDPEPMQDDPSLKVVGDFGNQTYEGDPEQYLNR